MVISQIVDSAIGVVSPERMTARKVARERSRMFDSMKPERDKLLGKIRAQSGIHKGAQTRDYTNWASYIGSQSADDDNIDDIPVLRDRTREAIRDNGIAAGAAQTLASNIVGGGIRTQAALDRESLGLSDDDADAIERAMDRVWNRFVAGSDIAGRSNFSEQQRIAMRQSIESGEFLAMLMRRDRAWSPYSLGLMSIDPNRMSKPATIKGDKYADADIRDGVEIGPLGEAVAYWIEKPRKMGVGGDIEHTRLSARDKYGRPNVLHGFEPTRPGQSRGVSWFAPVLDLFKQLDEYVEAELIGARVAACFSVFVKKSNPYSEGHALYSDTNDDGDFLENLRPGLVSYLGKDEDISIANPQRPGVTFDPFVNLMLRIVSVGLDIPYELLINKWDGANYSVARTVLLEARRKWRVHQQWLARTMCVPVWQLMMEEAWLRGEFPMIKDFYAKKHLWTGCRTIPEGWQWVDPEKEVNAAEKAISIGLSSLAHEAGSQGRDWKETIEQLGREGREKRSLGVIDQEKESEIDGRLVRVGLKLPIKEMYQRYGRQAPSEGETATNFEDNKVRQFHLALGLLTINEARAELGLPSVAWGEVPVRTLEGIGIQGGVDTPGGEASDSGSKEGDNGDKGTK